jgi:hypothetical protein
LEFERIGWIIWRSDRGKRSVKQVHYVMTTVALLWLSAVLWLVFSDAMATDVSRVGAIAGFLHKVPAVVGTPIFILLWIVFLLGWLVLLTFGVRPLFRRR